MDFTALYSKQTDPRILLAAKYFGDQAPGAAIPYRRDFRPEKVRTLLGNIFLVKHLPEENDYQYTLSGTVISVLFGTDLDHMHLRQMSDVDSQRVLRQTYDAVISSRSYHYVRGRYVWPSRSIEIERLLVPMLNSEGDLDTIFGLTVAAIPNDALVIYAGRNAAILAIDEEVKG